MKLGIQRSGGFGNIADVLVDASTAEQQGFASYWLPRVDTQLDSLIAISVAGQVTSTIELGAGIVPAWTQHPLTLGQSALSASSATQGRLSLGIGVVSKASVEHTWGIPYEHPLTYMREYAEILRQVLRNQPVDYSGKILTARAPAVLPGAAEPPLYMAALGEQMLKLAGSQSDGATLFLTGPRTIETHSRPILMAAAEAAGRPKPRLMVGVVVLCTDDVAGGRFRIQKKYGGWAAWPHYRAMFDLEGVEGAEDVAIVGDESRIREGFSRLFAAGVDDILCYEFTETQEEKDRTRGCLVDLLSVG